jgi:crossover junction endodeoxyribonuclease RuvC
VIVLGVDPGSTVTGYGVVSRADAGGGPPRLIECGVVRPPAGRDMGRRLAAIHADITQLIARHRPDVLAIETVFVAHNARSALVLGQARGVVVLAAAQAGVAVAEYAPALVKQSVTGTGAATKVQVQHMTARLLKLAAVPKPADAADGVALALTHCLRSGRVLKRAVVG